MMASATGRFDSWDGVMAFAIALPGAEASTSYGAPTVRIRGKPIVYPGRERGSFAVTSPLMEKELLMETDPETFWETDHYRGWPAVLVRYGSVDRERIETVIMRAWWDRASKAQRSDYGPRP
jgi:hypothetical protein